eukprot:768667-Hanusia_phi.AAC.9
MILSQSILAELTHTSSNLAITFQKGRMHELEEKICKMKRMRRNTSMTSNSSKFYNAGVCKSEDFKC